MGESSHNVNNVETNSADDDAVHDVKDSGETRRLIEIGWILAGRMSSVDNEAVESAHQRVLRELTETFPSFEWRMPIVRREENVAGPQVEPTVLLQHALAERNVNHWDFPFMVTECDLRGYGKPSAMAVVSRALDAAVLSTARIDPRAVQPDASNAERAATIADRLSVMAMHALGHLNGLPHTENRQNYMFNLQTTGDLNEPANFNDEQISALAESLGEIADLRLEERTDGTSGGRILFYLRSAWINRREIATAVWQARPWEFPFRLSRLTVASLSTMVVMLLTAEAWDLGASQHWIVNLLLPLLAIAVTTMYVMVRQRLVLRHAGGRGLTEQSVMTNISTLAIVASGMLATFLSVFCLASLITLTLFRESLVERWAESIDGDIGLQHYLTLATFVASVGLGVGALGASFEGQHYFQHVTFVDEEI